MSRFRRRLTAAALAVSGAVLLLPAAGQAAQIFGSDLLQQPNQPDCFELGPCTIAAFVEVPAEGQLSTAGAPINGVITKFRLRAKVEKPTQATLRVASVTPEGMPPNTATATAGEPGPTVTLQPSDGEAAQEFAARLPVKMGQHLALEGTGLTATHDSSGSRFSYAFAPPLIGGQARKSTEFLGELLVQATVEPDADGDGFGDETQDKCPTEKTEGAACDTTKPAISGFKVAAGKVSYNLSEPASTRFVLTKKAHRRFKRVGRAFTGSGTQGLNKINLPGARRLAAGRYRLTLTATDPAGNTGVKAVGFSIRKR